MTKITSSARLVLGKTVSRRAVALTGLLAIMILVGTRQTLAKTPEPSTVLVLGDSLSSAYGTAIDEGWVSLLSQRLVDQNRPWRVVNASVPGDTASAGAVRVQALLARHQPELVIIELGGNDGLRGTPINTIKQSLAIIVEQVQAVNAQPVLLGMRLPPNYGKQYTDAFFSVYRDLAADYALPFVPFLMEGLVGKPGMMQSDRVHPTAAAQATMLDTVWTVLDPLVK